MRAMRKVSQVWSAVRFAVVAAPLFVGLVAPVQAQAASHAEQVLALVNVERKKVGLKPLALSQRCQAQADKRAKEICQRGRFNHKGAFNVLRGYGWMGENIAKGYRSPSGPCQMVFPFRLCCNPAWFIVHYPCLRRNTAMTEFDKKLAKAARECSAEAVRHTFEAGRPITGARGSDTIGGVRVVE